MFSTITPPPSVNRCCRDIVPVLHQSVSESRLTALVAEIVATDRWNSFDVFHQTTDTLLRRLREAGAVTECSTTPTGGEIGRGRWNIQEAQDVRSATVDIIQPVQRRIVDYADNPWQLVQWSSGTPPTGPKADVWCRDHLAVGIWSPDSPIGHFVHGGGYLLGLGVNHDTCTAYHVADISLPCGCLDQFGSCRRIVNDDGTIQIVNGLAWRAGECPVSPGHLAPALDSQGCQQRGKVGAADCFLVKAVDLWHVRRTQLKGACPDCSITPHADHSW